MDTFLAEALLKKVEQAEVEFLARDSITNRLLEKMSPFIELNVPGREPSLK
jgi:hypothetical protein